MLGRTVGIVAASTLGASAFLIPSNLAPFGTDKAVDLTIAPGGLNTKQSVVQLPCSECAFLKKQQKDGEDVAGQTGEDFWIQGGANSVVVNLTVSEDGHSLQVNGEPIYPVEFQLERMWTQRIYVNQVPSSASLQEIESGEVKTTPLEVTGSGISIAEENVVSPEGDTVIAIKHSIFELEKQPVSLDDVYIKVLKTAGGELFIAHVSTEGHHAPHPADFFGPPEWAKDMKDDLLSIMPRPHKASHGPPEDFGRAKECKNMPAGLCKLKIMIEEKLGGMRLGHGRKGGFKKGGCHGAKGGKLPAHIRPHFLRIGQDDEETPRHMRPHGHHGGHRHHKHHFMHSFAHGLLAVLIPTMAGIAVGMVVSLVGLCLGRVISFLWIHFYRGGRRGYESVRVEEEDVAGEEDMEEKSYIVLEQSEPLPLYEEAPSYEEVQQEQK